MNAIDWRSEPGKKEFRRLLMSYELVLKECGVRIADFRLTDQPIAMRFYALSFGLIGIVANLLSEALELAFMEEDDELRYRHLQEAAKGRAEELEFNPFDVGVLMGKDQSKQSMPALSKAGKDVKLLPAPAELGSAPAKKPGRGRKPEGQLPTIPAPKG